MQLRTTIVVAHGLDGLKDNKLTGNVTRVHEGDAVEQAERLADLQVVFGTEFDRGELTVESLRPVLWAAHWLKAIRPVAQRASELLSLAADRAFEPGSKAARDCDAVGRVLASVATTEPHCLTAIEAARKIRVPADFYAGEDIAASALRADGIRPTAFLTSEESQALAEQIRSTANAVEAVGAELSESEVQATDDAGSTVGADDSPFRLYQFAHEMYELLKRIRVKVGAVHVVLNNGRQPSPTMQCECDQAISDIWSLLARIDGRDPLETDVDGRDARRAVIEASERHQAALDQAERAEALCQRLEKSMTCEILEADFTTSIIRLQARQPLVGINGGLWKLVPYQCKSGNAGGAA
nr:hypothetical protein [uncultured Pseudomonas sp.]